MDKKQRKALFEEYKNRQPEIGVISIRCKTTGESFLDTSIDTNIGFNSIRAKLSMNSHPNKKLQELWDTYGSDDFEYLVVKTLNYDNYNEDHTAKLKLLREDCLKEIPLSSKIWK